MAISNDSGYVVAQE